MGYKPWDSSGWKAVDSTVIKKAKTVDDIYTSKELKDEYNPRLIKVRESCDSEAHPESRALIVGLDVTGSMGHILDSVARRLGDMVEEVLQRKPIADPHIMFMAIGDAHNDRAPLQVTQFETDAIIAKQLFDLWFEKRGGGNDFESYPLAWYYAATHTKMDCFDKRNQKGFLFTMGDDGFPNVITAEEVKAYIGDDIQGDIPVESVLEMASRKFHVFHLLLEEGGSASSMNVPAWKKLMGGNAIPVSDYKKIPEIIVSTLEKLSGKSDDAILDSWDSSTALVVRNAIANIQVAGVAAGGGFVEL